MNTISFGNLEIIISILVFASLTAYVFFAYYELKTSKNSEHIQFVNNLIAFSMVWIFECIAIVFYYFSKEIFLTNIHIRIIGYMAAIVAVAVVAAAIDFMKKKKMQLIPFLPVNIIITLVALYMIISDITVGAAFNVVFAAFCSICLIFAIETFRFRKKVTRVGLLYIINGAIVLVILNSRQDLWEHEFLLTLDMAFAMLLTVGFFIYYIEVYSASITEKIDNIERKNTELTLAEKRISNLAYYDQVTHLKNIYKLQEDIEASALSSTYFLMINLTNFKIYNSFAGYEKGNRVLLDIAGKLKECMSPEGDIYRFYSDKFIVIHLGTRESTIELVENIQNVFRSNTFCSVPLMPYVGITAISDECKSFDRLVQELELVSSRIKNNSMHYAFYDEQWYREFQDRLQLETELRNAVKKKAWQIFFQPKIALDDSRVLGAEAVIRWESREKQVSPQVFIPLSEQLGLIKDIGEYVIEAVFGYINNINKTFSQQLNISINLSPYQLMEKGFSEYVAAALKKEEVTPSGITFEITESALMSNLDSVNDSILHLKEMGFRFSLDDFGTGYSSLNYFSKLDLDEVKFDKTFTQSLPYDEKNIVILDTFTKMAKKLAIDIVIEGVETREQFECVRDLGCDAYQGFYYSEPLPYEDFIDLIKSKSSQV
ncbi:MAG: EAL domain-containing protein [Bacillota bacterium]